MFCLLGKKGGAKTWCVYKDESGHEAKVEAGRIKKNTETIKQRHKKRQRVRVLRDMIDN